MLTVVGGLEGLSVPRLSRRRDRVARAVTEKAGRAVPESIPAASMKAHALLKGARQGAGAGHRCPWSRGEAAVSSDTSLCHRRGGISLRLPRSLNKIKRNAAGVGSGSLLWVHAGGDRGTRSLPSFWRAGPTFPSQKEAAPFTGRVQSIYCDS